jgi:hypothetical protein
MIAVLALGLAAPASAQLMGATELKIAVPAKGAASTKPAADIYYFAGEVGAKESYVLTGKGAASLTVFGPDGSELLTASGNGTVKLTVVLPFTDVFTLAVARKAPGQPYSLVRKTTVPTLAEASQAIFVGYRFKGSITTQCWIVPGVKMRMANPDGSHQDSTVAADRTTVSFVMQDANGTSPWEESYAVDGDQLHATMRAPDGRVKEESRPFFRPAYNADYLEAFTGYLCKD